MHPGLDGQVLSAQLTADANRANRSSHLGKVWLGHEGEGPFRIE